MGVNCNREQDLFYLLSYGFRPRNGGKLQLKQVEKTMPDGG